MLSASCARVRLSAPRTSVSARAARLDTYRAATLGALPHTGVARTRRSSTRAAAACSSKELDESIRSLMRTSAQPVAVIAAFMPTQDAVSGEVVRHIHTATLSSFTTVSLAPPLVAFSLRLPSRLADALRAGAVSTGKTDSAAMTTAVPRRRPHFLIHLLSSEQYAIADYFARPGAAPFLVPGQTSDTKDATADVDAAENVDGDHPYEVHPTQNSAAVDGMLVFDHSMGTLACSLVSQIDLTSPDLHGTMFTQSEDGEHAADAGSALFIARIHEVEPSPYTDKTPLVYFKQQYCTVRGSS